MRRSSCGVALLVLALCRTVAPAAAENAQPASVENLTDFSEAAKTIPKPREIWPILREEHVVPRALAIKSDEIVASDTDPSLKLRKVRAHFWSQRIGGKKWGHPCVILMPADAARNAAPPRKGRVVIYGGGTGEAQEHEVAEYGEPIAARTGYPTMVLANPGEYEDGGSIENDIGILGRLARETGKSYYNMNCQLAVVYIQAMNVFQEILGLPEVAAVVGGHSKRGRSAVVAAAMDSRVASAIIMGNEGIYTPDRPTPAFSFYYPFFQDQVSVPVFYLGVTNEGGYKMFNVTLMEKQLRAPLTVEMIPNYVHSTYHPVQYLDFLMWVAHTFDGRPLSRISDVAHERQAGRTFFRAKVAGGAKIKNVSLWIAYSDNAEWRDVMWYQYLMRDRGDCYETSIHGKMPDAFLIEVSDIAQGISGYVSTVPYKLTDAPVVERDPKYGYLPRFWKPAND
ncbi:MAG TPA: PhoPQ-activated protein PqaA family protein [Planctomycetota bacterium]|nr:hypothetical protein [Planctomycetota bacterium]OQC19630.1 MAG: PhoPQ-activated pathogenicity-related protein [Planctomycetes bacterium ADurb.Bin069]HNR97998.1 PhoPQ-activated protein PqaA family protein [Planctomycetota bacterium]HNU24476.1 PhoPQ-activated protein PqaA family protein [Planctomycetota bacterium]HOE29134.1 PhoPQ-activated protein PqaA family protein [Planctomycetota bacterium]